MFQTNYEAVIRIEKSGFGNLYNVVGLGFADNDKKQKGKPVEKVIFSGTLEECNQYEKEQNDCKNLIKAAHIAMADATTENMVKSRLARVLFGWVDSFYELTDDEQNTLLNDLRDKPFIINTKTVQ